MALLTQLPISTGRDSFFLNVYVNAEGFLTRPCYSSLASRSVVAVLGPLVVGSGFFSYFEC